jgi:hypothetical protein
MRSPTRTHEHKQTECQGLGGSKCLVWFSHGDLEIQALSNLHIFAMKNVSG